MNAPDLSPPLQAQLLPDGSVVMLSAHGVMLNLFPANALEGGPANLWLRRLDGGMPQALPLLGPRSPLVTLAAEPCLAHAASGRWQGLKVDVQLRLARADAALFWHVVVTNESQEPVTLDLLWAQDVGLAPLGTVRINEHYVSHYLDLSPLPHAQHGTLLAVRQGQPVNGRFPWLLAGSLHRAVSYATDGWQLHGLGTRAGGEPAALLKGLPGQRLQHEHALVALQEQSHTLAPGAQAHLGHFLLARAHHPQASGSADLAEVDALLALPEAQPLALDAPVATVGAAPSLFARAPWFDARPLSDELLDTLCPGPRRHVERDGGGALLSYWRGEHTHGVLREKELQVQRPHGHLLHSVRSLVPDETALASTVWMAGVFHSMLTQGHVGINRMLSTVRGMLGQFRSHGVRMFVDRGQGWLQLGVPSVWEMEPDACRWVYRDETSVIEVVSQGQPGAHAMALELQVVAGPDVRVRVTHHVCLAGDDGVTPAPPLAWRPQGDGVFVPVVPGSELAARFPAGGFVVEPLPGTRFAAVADDGALLDDGTSRGQPVLCVDSAPVRHFGLRLRGALVAGDALAAEPLPLPQMEDPAGNRDGALQQWADIAPWFRHDALVHYLSPRGLEQFSGGGWGTRDVCQGPLEMLLALDRPAPVRDLLSRVFASQNADGDWPQWFMFFERERDIRAGDSHGDIVYWPLVGLARYLHATADAAFLDQPLPYHDAPAEPLWQHVQRALQVTRTRRIQGTALAAYGHGDWNDSLQPADPSLREHLCSAWTVTLHHQALSALCQALAAVGRHDDAATLADEAAAVRADFRRWLMPGGVVAGYALFEPGQPPEWLLHPQDRRTGLRYSLLPLMHAVLESLLTPDEAQVQAALIEQHLMGPDGARLFDRPLPYHGGPMTLFQRAESAAFFGREIGVMYMHAHVRWAEMLAHLGHAERFWQALQQVHPVGLAERLPQASRRQSNCYYSSSDAAFPDRWQAQQGYDRIAAGTVALDGGWRVYSSGPGLALGVWITRFLGLRREHDHVVLDPVVAPSLRGVVALLDLCGHAVRLDLRPGARGCGVRRLELDGRELPFTPEPNAYRDGGARLDRQALHVALAAAEAAASGAVPALVVHLG